MDMMIPYLGKIIRLDIESKRAFQIAGVQQTTPSKKVQLQSNKKQATEKKYNASKAPENTKDEKPDDDIKHLDTWA